MLVHNWGSLRHQRRQGYVLMTANVARLNPSGT
jgi:hypothetical protein